MFKIKVRDAVDKLSKTEMGIHYLIIYSSIQTLRQFYSQYTKRQIIENNEYVLINPFYETIGSDEKNAYKDRLLNQFKNEEEEALLIIDAFHTYLDQKSLEKSFDEKIINRSMQIRKKGISIMNEIGPFPFKGMFKRILEYELSLPSAFNMPIKLFCLFYQEDFEEFSFEQKQKLIECHGKVLRIID
ncbi:MAG: hypothetical protein ACTHKJ_02070 [Candidatus Nitrosocosmicus sp.]